MSREESGTATVRSVRVRLVPWRPRWRVRDGDVGWDVPDFGVGVFDFDDPISAVLSGIVLLLVLPVVLLFLVGLVAFGFEIALLLALFPLLIVGQVTHLRPWVLVLTDTAGRRQCLEVTGTRAMWRTRRELRRRITR